MFQLGEFYRTRMGVEILLTERHDWPLQILDPETGEPKVDSFIRGVIVASGAPASWDINGKFAAPRDHPFDLLLTDADDPLTNPANHGTVTG